MPRKLKNLATGIMVMINSANSRKIVKLIKKTRRTFATEVNVGVEEYADKKIAEYRDNGK